MSETIRSMVLALDAHRTSPDGCAGLVDFAKALGADIRIRYVVDLLASRSTATENPLHHSGSMIAGRSREGAAADAAKQATEALRDLCKARGVRAELTVLSGIPEPLWAEEARASDLMAIRPLKTDIGSFEKLFGDPFRTLTLRGTRPLLLFRRERISPTQIILFYSYEVAAARALPWVGALAGALGARVIVQPCAFQPRLHVREEECLAFFRRHHVPVEMLPEITLKDLQAVCDVSSPVGDERRLLAFDGGFLAGSCLRRHRRIMTRIVQNVMHHILLLP